MLAFFEVQCAFKKRQIGSIQKFYHTFFLVKKIVQKLNVNNDEVLNSNFEMDFFSRSCCESVIIPRDVCPNSRK